MSNAPMNIPSRGAPGRGAHSGYERLAKGLGVFSIGLGLAELLMPRTLCRVLGMPGQENLIRAYGVREAMTGVAILMSHDPTPWIAGRVAGDAVDLATLAYDLPEGGPERTGRALATVAVAGVTLLDVACAYGLAADKRLSPAGAFDYGNRSGFPRSPRAMRGAAADFEVPAGFRVPDPLRPWRSGKPGRETPERAPAFNPNSG